MSYSESSGYQAAIKGGDRSCFGSVVDRDRFPSAIKGILTVARFNLGTLRIWGNSEDILKVLCKGQRFYIVLILITTVLAVYET